VWRRNTDGSATRYRCFEALPQGGFCVQSADCYRSSITPTQVESHTKQYIELLSEMAPSERSPLFPTLEDAIRNFNLGFADFWKDFESSKS
jgi:hypothetical protein